MKKLLLGIVAAFMLQLAPDSYALNGQQQADAVRQAIFRTYRVLLWHDSVAQSRKTDPVYIGDPVNVGVQTNYVLLALITSSTLNELRKYHDILEGWSDRYANVTWNAIDFPNVSQARLRTLYATKNELSGACATSGFTNESFATGTTLFQTQYRVTNAPASLLVQLQGRLEYLRNDARGTVGDRYQELWPIYEDMITAIGTVRRLIKDGIVADAKSRNLEATVNEYTVGDALFGPKMDPLTGGLYLLNEDVVCSDPVPDEDSTKANILGKLPDLI